MKKGKLHVIGIAVLFLVGACLLVIQVTDKEKETTNIVPHLSKEERDELQNLMGKISNRLHDGNYGFVLDHAVLPNGNIEVLVKLGSLKIDKKTKEQIQLLATDVIKQNDFDTNMFQFNITSFYDSEKEGNRFAQRLSYNDVMGDIMLSLSEENFAAAVHGEVSSDQNFAITIVLPHDQFDENSRKKVQQIATDVIVKNRFEPEIFQFNLTTYINKKQ